jgi:hypothetical protein
MTIFMKKNAIFIFLKIPIKRRTKNIYYYFRHFFHFLLFLKKKIKNKKGKSWTKIWQKSWAFNIFQHAIQAQRHNNQMKRTCHPVEFFRA